MARRFRKIRYDEKKGQVTLIWEDGKAHVEMLTETAEPNAKMLLTAECIETLEMLIDEAHEYVKGVRAQGDLFTPAVGESA